MTYEQIKPHCPLSSVCCWLLKPTDQSNASLVLCSAQALCYVRPLSAFSVCLCVCVSVLRGV
jgi:hypothetical protein